MPLTPQWSCYCVFATLCEIFITKKYRITPKRGRSACIENIGSLQNRICWKKFSSLGLNFLWSINIKHILNYICNVYSLDIYMYFVQYYDLLNTQDLTCIWWLMQRVRVNGVSVWFWWISLALCIEGQQIFPKKLHY